MKDRLPTVRFANEIKEACQRIEHLFVSNQHGDRVGDASNPVNVRNLLAYKSYDLLADTSEFWVPTAIFNKELADGVDKSELIKELLKREWLTKGDRADRHTNRRTMDKRQQSFFVFTPFWLDRNSQSIIEKTEKSTDLTDLTDYESCNGVNSEFQSSPNLVRNENDNGLKGFKCKTAYTRPAIPNLDFDNRVNRLNLRILPKMLVY